MSRFTSEHECVSTKTNREDDINKLQLNSSNINDFSPNSLSASLRYLSVKSKQPHKFFIVEDKYIDIAAICPNLETFKMEDVVDCMCEKININPLIVSLPSTIIKLKLVGSYNSITTYPKNLEELDVQNFQDHSFANLPKSLRILRALYGDGDPYISAREISILPNLQEFHFKNFSITDDANLSLKAISAYSLHIELLKRMSPSLEYINIYELEGDCSDLSGFKKLIHLDIVSTLNSKIIKLPPNLKTFTFLRPPYIPHSLHSLRCSSNYFPKIMHQLPQSLHTLETDGFTPITDEYIDYLPSSLTKLSWESNGYLSNFGLSQLPPNLKYFSTRSVSFDTSFLKHLPQSLEHLVIFNGGKIDLTGMIKLRKLRTLRINYSEITSMPSFVETLRYINFSGSTNPDIKDFPSNLKILVYPFDSLEGIINLLPENLEEIVPSYSAKTGYTFDYFYKNDNEFRERYDCIFEQIRHRLPKVFIHK